MMYMMMVIIFIIKLIWYVLKIQLYVKPISAYKTIDSITNNTCIIAFNSEKEALEWIKNHSKATESVA